MARGGSPSAPPQPDFEDLSDHPTVTFQTLLERVYSIRYNGLLVLHMHNGRVRRAELGRPITLYVDDGPPARSTTSPSSDSP